MTKQMTFYLSDRYIFVPVRGSEHYLFEPLARSGPHIWTLGQHSENESMYHRPRPHNIQHNETGLLD